MQTRFEFLDQGSVFAMYVVDTPMSYTSVNLPLEVKLVMPFTTSDKDV
jgi:hypothetical protein